MPIFKRIFGLPRSKKSRIKKRLLRNGVPLCISFGEFVHQYNKHYSVLSPTSRRRCASYIENRLELDQTLTGPLLSLDFAENGVVVNSRKCSESPRASASATGRASGVASSSTASDICHSSRQKHELNRFAGILVTNSLSSATQICERELDEAIDYLVDNSITKASLMESNCRQKISSYSNRTEHVKLINNSTSHVLTRMRELLCQISSYQDAVYENMTSAMQSNVPSIDRFTTQVEDSATLATDKVAKCLLGHSFRDTANFSEVTENAKDLEEWRRTLDKFYRHCTFQAISLVRTHLTKVEETEKVCAEDKKRELKILEKNMINKLRHGPFTRIFVPSSAISGHTASNRIDSGMFLEETWFGNPI